MVLAVIAFLAVVWWIPDQGGLTVLVGTLAAGGGFWLDSRLWPNAKCWVCRGDSRRVNPDGTAWRHCWRCKGSGRRRRLFAGDLP